LSLSKREERRAWIEDYVRTFLATYSATRYDDACFTGIHVVFDNQPVEDAYFIAGRAWKKLQEWKHDAGDELYRED
jgi:hypothetical protein